MSDDLRIEAMPFGDGYFAVIHRPGQPDEIVDGEDGRPRKFATATEALGFAKRAFLPSAPAIEDGIAAWRRERDRRLAAERERVFSARGRR